MKKKRDKPYRPKKHSHGIAKIFSVIELGKYDALDQRQKVFLADKFFKLNEALEQGTAIESDMLQLNCFVAFLIHLENHFNNKVNLDEAIKIHSVIAETRYNLAYRWTYTGACKYQDNEQEIIMGMWDLISQKLDIMTNNEYNQLWNIAVGLERGHKYDIVGNKTHN